MCAFESEVKLELYVYFTHNEESEDVYLICLFLKRLYPKIRQLNRRILTGGESGGSTYYLRSHVNDLTNEYSQDERKSESTF